MTDPAANAAKWPTLICALVAVVGTPTGVALVQAFRPPPEPPAVTAIAWEAHEDRVDRIEAKLDALLELRKDEAKLRDERVDRIEARVFPPVGRVSR